MDIGPMKWLALILLAATGAVLASAPVVKVAILEYLVSETVIDEVNAVTNTTHRYIFGTDAPVLGTSRGAVVFNTQPDSLTLSNAVVAGTRALMKPFGLESATVEVKLP